MENENEEIEPRRPAWTADRLQPGEKETEIKTLQAEDDQKHVIYMQRNQIEI
jgi:hypothetical protein